VGEGFPDDPGDEQEGGKDMAALDEQVRLILAPGVDREGVLRREEALKTVEKQKESQGRPGREGEARPRVGIHALILAQRLLSSHLETVRTRRDALAREVREGGPLLLQGVFGRPFVCLDNLFDLSALSEIHEEICLALAQMPVGYTGGSHRSMGIMPRGCEGEALVDYQEVIRGLDDASFATFRSLADDPSAIDVARRGEVEFGEERDVPLSMRQMLWLKMRHRVYFPWKVYAELIPNQRWEDKCDLAGKRFTRRAEALFPKTIAFVKKLPFAHIGRCNVMGLEAHDHGTVHRDGAGHAGHTPDPFLTICPRGDKRLYVMDEGTGDRIPVEGRVVWFNDHDYHGVFADPFFRYSVRVDGPFTPEFSRTLESQYQRQP
jgi:hypothetical protein